MINEYGLYRTTVPRWKIPGLKSDRQLDEQTQGWWLPLYDKEGNIYMVDTYHIEMRNTKSGKTILDRILEDAKEKKDNSWLISRANTQYYYGGSIKVTEETEKYFEEVCDLREFEIAKWDDIADYGEKDSVLNVQLYWEHHYPNGICLLRKGVTKNIIKEAENFISKIEIDISDAMGFDRIISNIHEFGEKIQNDEENGKISKETKDYIIHQLMLLENHANHVKFIKEKFYNERSSYYENKKRLTKKFKEEGKI